MAPVYISLEGYEALAQAICQTVGGLRGTVERRDFPDGERYQRLITPVHDREVVIVGGTVSDSATLCLYDLACATVKYGARRLTMVVPYFGYSTMERAARPGEVVTAKTRARLLSAVPPAPEGNCVVLLDLHSEGIPHYFEGGVTTIHVDGRSALIDVMRDVGGSGFVLGSTDAGRAKLVESLANDMGVDAAIILKRRTSGSETQVVAVTADVAHRTVVIYDDMVRTGGSLLGAGRAYLDAGAASLVAVCTHGVFPGDAYQRLRDSGLFADIIATDSHPNAVARQADGLRVVSVAGVLSRQLV